MSQSPNTLIDFCDGSAFNEHLLYSKDHKALQIVLYFDELEICNPLGSRKKKHKLGICYKIILIFKLNRCFLFFTWKY